MSLLKSTLYPFQAEAVAKILETQELVVLHSTGLGKSVVALATAALLTGHDQIDHTLLVAEKDKIGKDEWLGDVAEHTELTAATYHGPRRKALLEDPPQVLITTYETAWRDNVELLAAFEYKRVLIVYDEVTRMRTRTTKTWKGHHAMVDDLRGRVTLPGPHLWIMGLTATPVEKSVEDYYNFVSIISPEHAGDPMVFEDEHVSWRDDYGRARTKNVAPRDTFDHTITPFTTKMAPIVHIKSKTDSDVIDQFPSLTEEYTVRPLEGNHADLYDIVDQWIAAEHPEDPRGFNLLRQVLLYPEALLVGTSEFAASIVSSLGPKRIRNIGSTKREWLLRDLGQSLDRAGEQALVFCFYGPSVLSLLARDLMDAGYSVVSNHGAISNADRETGRAKFKTGDVQVMLSGDSGARGLNYPDVGYVINFDVPPTHSLYTQRTNRIHRINSDVTRVKHARTYIASGTLDEALFGMWNRTERSTDMVLDPDNEFGLLPATQRSRLVQNLRDRSENR